MIHLLQSAMPTIGLLATVLDPIRSLDAGVVRDLLELGQNHIWLALFFYFCAQHLTIFLVLPLFALWRAPEAAAWRHGHRKAVIMAAFTILSSLAVKAAIGFLWTRPRPFVSHLDIIPLPAQVDPASFPSGHALVAFSIAWSIWFSGHRKLGAWLLAGATLVAIGRVGIGVHYPSDIIAGAIVAFVMAWILHREGSSIKKYLPE